MIVFETFLTGKVYTEFRIQNKCQLLESSIVVRCFNRPWCRTA